jgi:hypothetical protein
MRETAHVPGYGGWYSSLSLDEDYVFLIGQFCEFDNCSEEELVVDLRDPDRPAALAPEAAPPFPLASPAPELLLQAGPDVHDPLQVVEEIVGPGGPTVYLRGQGYSILDDGPAGAAASTVASDHGSPARLSPASWPTSQPGWRACRCSISANPFAPEVLALLGGEALGGEVGRAFLAAGRLYLSVGYAGLSIFDVSSPAQPKALGVSTR